MTAKELKNAILQLAVQGKLVPQNPDDEPASELLKRIQAEKARLVKERKIKKVKPLPPISEDEKPFEIPASWEWVRLGIICDYGTCQSQTNIPLDAWLLDLEDIEKDTGRLLNRIKVGDRKSSSSKHVFRKGMVLYSKLRTYLNKVSVADMDGYCTSEILPLDFGKDVDAGYARLILMSPFFLDYTAQCGYGMKMPRFGTEDGRRALFPLPPLKEQKRIVYKIEELMPLVEEFGKKEERLSALDVEFPDALRKSILQQAIQGKLTKRDPADEPASELLKRIRAEKAKLLKSGKNRIKKPLPPITEDEMPFEIPVGWLAVRIGDIGIYKKGPFGSSITKNMFVPKGPDAVKVYEQKNAIQKNHSIGDYYIRKSYFEEKLRGFEVFPGDVIVSCAGTIGETYVMPDGIERGIINQALMRMKIVPSLNLDYFLLYFDYILKKTAQRSSKGSAIKNIPPFEIFKKMVLPLPPLAEQQRIVERVNELIAMCDELKAVSNRMES